MTAAYPTLDDHLAGQDVPEALKVVVAAIAAECVAIAGVVRLGGLAGALGLAGTANVQD
ncbi:MAG: fructose-bisphosphatase class I, partial [Brevundimonas sp.]|nr:fructose-bisphosphatase class I [Brevundimonas sp.]